MAGKISRASLRTIRPDRAHSADAAGSVIHPSRRVAGILGFLVKGEVDAIFDQNPLRPVDAFADPITLWRQSFAARTELSPLDPNSHRIETLADEFLPAVEEIKSRRTYRASYERIADYHFGMAPTAGLLAPQWMADMDYVDELAARLSVKMTVADLLQFAMPEGNITEPMIRGNQVLFTSTRPNLNAMPVPDVREVGDGEVEIVVRASNRPNYVQVAELNGRLVLVNGVHKVLALHRRGYTHIPCLWRRIHDLAETGMNQQTSLFIDQTFKGPRPAMVLDFLNEQIAVLLSMRSTYHVLRVSIGVDSFQVPAV
jgi:hypothetical protein